jgi:hypothetical protein
MKKKFNNKFQKIGYNHFWSEGGTTLIVSPVERGIMVQFLMGHYIHRVYTDVGSQSFNKTFKNFLEDFGSMALYSKELVTMNEWAQDNDFVFQGDKDIKAPKINLKRKKPDPPKDTTTPPKRRGRKKKEKPVDKPKKTVVKKTQQRKEKKKPTPQKKKEITISALGLSTRPRNALKINDILLLKDVPRTLKGLMKLENMGKKSALEVLERLEKINA